MEGTFIPNNQNNNYGLKLLQWNARGLRANGDEFKSFLDNINYQPDIICIQETFFKDDTKYSFPNFNLVQKCRSDGRGGE